MNNKIAILLTTFERKEMAIETINSLQPYLNDNLILLIGDQNKSPINFKDNIFNNPFIYGYIMPHDCGLSYSRNQMIKLAMDSSYNYVLMSADSIRFPEHLNLEPYINFLESDSSYGIVGFELNGSKCPWEWKMKYTKFGIELDSSFDFIEYNGIKYKYVDICRNIFLAKTNTLVNLYDPEMKMLEHELSFLEYKKRGYKVFWTDSVSFQKITTPNPKYDIIRKQKFSYYKQLLMKKLKMSGWVKYSYNAMKEIHDYKQRRTS